MSEVENKEQTANNGMDIGNSPAQQLPAPGSDPFGGDDSDEITIIGGRPEPVKDTKRTQQSDFDENNIDFDELLGDNVSVNDEDRQAPAAQQHTQEQPQKQDADRKRISRLLLTITVCRSWTVSLMLSSSRSSWARLTRRPSQCR